MRRTTNSDCSQSYRTDSWSAPTFSSSMLLRMEADDDGLYSTEGKGLGIQHSGKRVQNTAQVMVIGKVRAGEG